MLTSDTIRLNIAALFGTSGNPITIDRSAGSWSASNPPDYCWCCCLLATADAGAHTAIPSGFDDTFSLEKTAGDIVLSANLSRATATILLETTAANTHIALSTYNISASSLTLTATGTLTGTGTLTSNTITLDIGAVFVPLLILLPLPEARVVATG